MHVCFISPKGAYFQPTANKYFVFKAVDAKLGFKRVIAARGLREANPEFIEYVNSLRANVLKHCFR
jgi:hypothetical protein